MSGYDEFMQESIRNQLVREPILLQNPRGVSLTDVYASSINSSLSLAEMYVSTNKGRISSNNLNFNGTSTFFISASSLVDNYVLNASIVLTTTNMVNKGWLFSAIREIQISFQQSQIQNTSISGKSLYDYCMITARDKETREGIIENAGHWLAGSGTSKGSIPIAFMLQAVSGNNGYPLDLAASGNLNINIVWNDSTYFIVGKTATAVASPPTSFTSLELCYTSTDLVDRTLAVQSVLNNDPELSYINPIKYLTTNIQQAPNYTTGTQVVFQINSFPTGNVIGMILNFYPKSWVTSALANKYMQSIDLDQITLEFSGSKIFDCQSLEEYRSTTLLKFGEPLLYNVNYSFGGVSYGSTPSDGDGDALGPCRNLTAGVYFIPLGKHMDRCLRENHAEVLSKFAGSNLLLTLKSKTNTVATVGKNTDYNNNGGNLTMYMPQFQNFVFPTGENYELNITYVVEGLLSVNRGVVKLIL